MLRFLFITVVLLIGAAAQAQTNAQLELLQSLSPEQRRVLLERYVDAEATPAPQAPLETPEVVRPLPEAAPRTEQGPLRAQPGDTLILTLKRREGPDPAAQDGPVLFPAAELLGSNVFELDAHGVLELPGLARVPLAGLTAAQAEARLSAEPALKGFDLGVQILPLKPAGPEALQPFGYDLFKGAPTTFAPATEIPVPADYVIGPGDTIKLQLYGKENTEYTLVVGRDGRINIPRIGPKSVAGLSFQALQQRLSDAVAAQMIGVQADVSLGPLRSIRVFVLGDVRRPGSYTVSGLSTMTNALFVSGGIKPIGSLRDIQLKRGGRIIKRLDLYDLLLRGDTSDDTRLQPGDVIFVPPVGTTVGIAGEVRRPAIYELKQEQTVAELIALAGGLLPTAAGQAAQLERIAPSGRREVKDVNLTTEAGRQVVLRAGDVLRIPPVSARMDHYVRLSGHVERPGRYQWREGLRLTDLIPDVNALKPRADLHYVLIKRELPPELRVMAFSARLDRAWARPGTEDDPLLQPRDEVMVFDLEARRAELLRPLIERLRGQARAGAPEPVVSVTGMVVQPGEYPLERGMRVSDLIRAAGGLAQQAYTLEAEITHYVIVEGQRRRLARSRVDLAAALAGDGEADRPLQPFGTLNIKRLPEWQDRHSVRIEGEVRFPGAYVVGKDETLRQLVERAGGFTERAYLPGAVFLRQELRVKEQAQIDGLRRRLRADLAAISLQQVQEDPQKQQALAMAQQLLQQLEATQAAGRLVIDLPRIMRDPKAADVVLRDGDRLVVPPRPQEVTVIGEVNYPTSHLYNPEFTRDDYIQRSGGLTYKADADRIYVVRANGEVLAGSGSRWFDRADQTIKEGDTIVVPLDAERMRPLALWSSVTQILYHIALSAAAFNAVGTF